MIERIYSQEQFSGLPESGVEAQKIRALFMAYGGGYDFCRFFRQSVPGGAAFFAALDGSFVVAGGENTDPAEIAQFLIIHGFTEVFCSLEVGNSLNRLLSANFSRVNLMEYSGTKMSAEISKDELCKLEKSPSEIWNIVGTRFEIPFEPWYLDMSHRVRHGISRCYSDGKAALVMQHNINGEALLSQVCVLKEYEGQGYAGKLLKEVSAEIPGRVQVICEDRLVDFYRRCGFVPAGEMTVITHK